LSYDINFGSAPGFDAQLDRLAKIGPGGFSVCPLRGHGKFRITRDVPIAFFRKRYRKAVSHTAMLTEGYGARNRRTTAGPQRDVHPQRFAFRARQQGDESVKISNTTSRQASAVIPALLTARPRLKRAPIANFYSIQINPFLPARNFQFTENKALPFFYSIPMKSRLSLITSH
jgi:hypothetical protein